MDRFYANSVVLYKFIYVCLGECVFVGWREMVYLWVWFFKREKLNSSPELSNILILTLRNLFNRKKDVLSLKKIYKQCFFLLLGMPLNKIYKTWFYLVFVCFSKLYVFIASLLLEASVCCYGLQEPYPYFHLIFRLGCHHLNCSCSFIMDCKPLAEVSPGFQRLVSSSSFTCVWHEMFPRGKVLPPVLLLDFISLQKVLGRMCKERMGYRGSLGLWSACSCIVHISKLD